MASFPSPEEYTGSGTDPTVVTPQHGMRGINVNTDGELAADGDWRMNAGVINYGED